MNEIIKTWAKLKQAKYNELKGNLQLVRSLLTSLRPELD